MKQKAQHCIFRNCAITTILMCCALLVGCITPRNNAQPPAEYDLGPTLRSQKQVQASASDVKANMVVIPRIKTHGVLNSRMIIYRFSNLQAYEPRAYTQSRWADEPGEMLRLRMQQIIGEKYPVILSSELAQKTSWILLASLEDFSQDFTAVDQSEGVVQLRVTLLHGGEVLGQKVFNVRSRAPTPDAAGGVMAISTGVDELLTELLSWLDSYIIKP